MFILHSAAVRVRFSRRPPIGTSRRRRIMASGKRACTAVTYSATLPSRKHRKSRAPAAPKRFRRRAWRVSFIQPCIAASSNAAAASGRAQPRRSNAQQLSETTCKMTGNLILQIKSRSSSTGRLAITCQGQQIQLQRRPWRRPSSPCALPCPRQQRCWPQHLSAKVGLILI